MKPAEYNYDFHGIVRMRVIKRDAPFFDHYLDGTFAHYRVKDIAEPDLLVIVDGYRPDTRGAVIVDNKYYVKEGQVYCRNRHKIAQWAVQIEGMESPVTTMRVDGNLASRSVFPGDTLYSMLRYKFALKGYPLVHGSGVGTDGRGFVFSGRGGAGKTITAINCVKRGFAYLSDDSTILGGDGILGMIVPFNLRFTYDVEALLGASFSPAKRRELLAKKILSACTFGRINLFTTLRPEELYAARIAEKSALTDIVILQQGPKLVFERDIARQDGLEMLWLNAQFEMEEILNLVYSYAYVFPRSRLRSFVNDFRAALDARTRQARFSRIFLPVEYTAGTFEQVYREITSWQS